MRTVILIIGLIIVFPFIVEYFCMLYLAIKNRKEKRTIENVIDRLSQYLDRIKRRI